VEEKSENECNKIFRFMAAAKRPLSAEELGEAISVEPCQPEFMPTRLLNDTNGIVRWCHGLVAFDDLDETLQFTHSSVKDFLCGPDTERITLTGFHFKDHEADRQLGEVCVTYLNFNDFKTQVVKYRRPATLPGPMMMASHALSAGSPSALLNKASHLMRRAKSTSARSRLLNRQTDNEADDTVTMKYHLYRYASEFWLGHTTKFLSESRTWNLFRALAEQRLESISELVIRTPPLEDGLLESMYTHKHEAFFCLYLTRFWDDTRFVSTLASILDFKCYSFIRLLPPLARKKSDTRWQELILSISDSDLLRTMELTHLQWLEDLTVTNRSEMLLKIMRVAPQHYLHMKAALIKSGVDPYHECDNDGKSTTLLEKMTHQPDDILLNGLCDAMIKSGADFSRKITQDGCNALHIVAASRNSVAVSKILTHSSSNALVNSTDDYGRTALHLSVQGKDSTSKSDVVGTVRELIKMGVPQDVEDASGKVALDYVSSEEVSSLAGEFHRSLVERLNNDSITRNMREGGFE
jgi:hypothetical protein